MLETEPAGRHDVYVCTNISCSLNGADALHARFLDVAGDDPDFNVRSFECLGACDLAPMASIDERFYGPLDGEDAAEAIEALHSGDEVLAGKAMAIRPLAGGPDGEPDPRVAGAG
jgi:NADH:ubiquinone oxidoreductase subunit E